MGASGVDVTLRRRRLHPRLPGRLPHPRLAPPPPRDGPRPVLCAVRHKTLSTFGSGESRRRRRRPLAAIS